MGGFFALYSEHMAVLAWSAWQRAGKPVWPAKPIEDIVNRLKVAFPDAASLFSWYANDAHYTAVPAEDHTPYSQTGWPGPSPEWYVFATDVMHRPDLGVDCNVLFPYWISEARAGRMPWLKYLIWQAKIYDVRYNWRAQANSGHFDHVHFSARTDYVNTGLGDWSLLPVSLEDDMPLYFKAVPSGRQCVTNGVNWWWANEPTGWGSHMYVLGKNGGKVPDPMPEIPDAQLDAGVVFGPQILPPTPPGPLNEEDLAAIGSKAYDGAKAGASDAVNGSTVTSTFETQAH